jgi:3-oxoacyl-[acyl-carrier protein] reductase
MRARGGTGELPEGGGPPVGSGAPPGPPRPGILGLEGARVLLTGGSSGIGQATARLLARAGARVAFTWNRGGEGARATSRALEAEGVPGVALQADLADEARVRTVWEEAEAALGGVDHVVVNHGTWPSTPVPLAHLTSDRWHHTRTTNLDSLFYLTREAAGRLPQGGSIVLLSSTAAQRGEAFHSDYAAVKGAVISLAKGLAVELAPQGVRVNVVAPGWVDTPMVAGALTGEARTRAVARIPLGRVATAEDVAGPILFLLSPLARHVTGEVLNVNGGAVLCG